MFKEAVVRAMREMKDVCEVGMREKEVVSRL
jgi:hypothetical protein